MTTKDAESEPGSTQHDRRTFLETIGFVTLIGSAVGIGCDKTGAPGAAGTTSVEELSIRELQAGMQDGRFTSRTICEAYLERIRVLDRSGPTLRAVLETNPEALQTAGQLDAERAAKGPRGALHGIPILVKDNIDNQNLDAGPGHLHTTSGSLALLDSPTPRDAFLVERLRRAGAVILGTANLSEWANCRSLLAPNGWSARGGQTVNPYALDRSPTGSSSGSAVAAAASLCAAAVGTETLGSIQTPSSLAGLVSVKPTVGLISRTGIIPISSTLDTAGPMARTVTDAAELLTAMAIDSDPEDEATMDPGAPRGVDYAASLDRDGLRGARIGLSYQDVDRYRGLRDLLQQAETVLRDLGAVVERVDYTIDSDLWPMLDEVLKVELKQTLGEYLRRRRPASRYKSLSDLIAFNRANAAREMRWFGQEMWEEADRTSPGAAYEKARHGMLDLMRARTLDPLFNQQRLDAVAGLAFPLPWKLDALLPDFNMEWTNVAASSAAGYPSVTVPMGQVQGLPIGLVLFGRRWTEAGLLRYAYAYEQATHHRKRPTYPLTVDPREFRGEPG